MTNVWLCRPWLCGYVRSDMRWRVSRWALVVAVATCLMVAPAVVGQGQTQVRIEPASAQLQTGESVTLQIVVADVQGLYGLDVRLDFDPAQVEVLDADPEKEGVQIQPGDFLFPDFVARNQADNQAGTIWFAITQLNPHEAVSGTGAVASITFRGKAAGTSSLSFTYRLLGTRQGNSIEAVTQDGQISVEGTAAAPTVPPAETEVPATETPVPPAPTDTPYPTATLPQAPTPTSTVEPALPTEALVPPSPEPATALATTETVATPTVKLEQPTEEPTAVPEQVTPTTEPISPAVPSPMPTSRRQVAIVTPTVEAPTASGGDSSSIALYGLVFVAAVGLLIWIRTSGGAV